MTIPLRDVQTSDATPQRLAEEKTFRTHDGVDLFYRHWPASAQPRRGAIVLFHRGHEHSGRMAHVVEELDLSDFDFYAWDARGHGRSPGERGYSPSIGTSVRDVETFVRHVATTYGIAVDDIAAVAQSVGAVLVAAWAHDYAPKMRAMVLASPAFKVKLYVPFARTGPEAAGRSIRGNFFVNSYVKAKFLTHDPERIASFEADPLITRAISVNILLGLYEVAERAWSPTRARSPIPTQLLISGGDWVVHHGAAAPVLRATRRADQGAPCPSRLLPRHAGRARPGDRGGARRATSSSPASTSRLTARRCIEADRAGYTRDEADRLASPLPPHCRRAASTGRLSALNLKIGGLACPTASRLGHQTGFDSGSTLDYVYRNQAERQGRNRAGDRPRLTSRRSAGAASASASSISRSCLRAGDGRCSPRRACRVHILDIAAGHGRYVLEALEGCERQAGVDPCCATIPISTSSRARA